MRLTKSSPLANALESYEDRIKGKFKPDRRFYNEVGINQKRFGQLLRQEKPILVSEAVTLSEFFGVDVKELF